MLQGYGDTVLRVEALEEQVVKSRKHAAAMQSKLDTAFAKYHNDIHDMQAKSDESFVARRSPRTVSSHAGWILEWASLETGAWTRRPLTAKGS
jgi:hypothetical protein